MSNKKTTKIQCVIFPKRRFNKSDIRQWCRRKGIKIQVNKKKKTIKKVDGDYILIVRQKNKFKSTRGKKTNGVKIVKGYLK